MKIRELDRSGLVIATAMTVGLAIYTGGTTKPNAPLASRTPRSPVPVSQCHPMPTESQLPPLGYIDVLVAEGASGRAAMLPAEFPEFAPGVTDERARWARVPVSSDPATAAAAFAAIPGVVEAYVEPTVSLPTSDTLEPADGEACPIRTPSYSEKQGYLAPAPGGIDAAAAWKRGTTGAGVWFADIEGNWNTEHEDLNGTRITHVLGQKQTGPGWRAHGTAVLGEVVGLDNHKGVTGIAPAVDRVFTATFANQGVGAAIDAAARHLRPGDVLLIELQGTGPRGRYLPMEYWDDSYAAIHAATDRGIVVIEAAGNGAENLDHKAYDRKFDRKVRDSGAIMIGAGGPPRKGYTDRERLDFSNYGSRVDVQGWGRGVATLDYGDLQRCDDESTDRHYTDLFSGTSSASPIVAGAAVLLESDARAHGGVIPPRELRALLVATGTPQVGKRAAQEHIGPRPDLARAFAARN